MALDRQSNSGRGQAPPQSRAHDPVPVASQLQRRHRPDRHPPCYPREHSRTRNADHGDEPLAPAGIGRLGHRLRDHSSAHQGSQHAHRRPPAPVRQHCQASPNRLSCDHGLTSCQRARPCPHGADPSSGHPDRVESTNRAATSSATPTIAAALSSDPVAAASSRSTVAITCSAASRCAWAAANRRAALSRSRTAAPAARVAFCHPRSRAATRSPVDPMIPFASIF